MKHCIGVRVRGAGGRPFLPSGWGAQRQLAAFSSRRGVGVGGGGGGRKNRGRERLICNRRKRIDPINRWRASFSSCVRRPPPPPPPSWSSSSSSSSSFTPASDTRYFYFERLVLVVAPQPPPPEDSQLFGYRRPDIQAHLAIIVRFEYFTTTRA